jgi:hypothetical protein
MSELDVRSMPLSHQALPSFYNISKLFNKKDKFKDNCLRFATSAPVGLSFKEFGSV